MLHSCNIPSIGCFACAEQEAGYFFLKFPYFFLKFVEFLVQLSKNFLLKAFKNTVRTFVLIFCTAPMASFVSHSSVALVCDC